MKAPAWSPKLLDVWVYEFDDDTVRRLHRRIERCLEEAQGVLPLYIMSEGGSVAHLLAMQDLIRSAEESDIKVATICLGQALSAGADLLASGTKGMRWAAPGAKIMVHESISSIPTDKLRENSAALTSDLNDDDKCFARLDDNCGKTKGYFRKELDKRKNVNWFMNAREAKRHGIIDQIGVPRFETDTTIAVKPPKVTAKKAKAKA
jgi:ATP-dependent Clp protease protease subunit